MISSSGGIRARFSVVYSYSHSRFAIYAASSSASSASSSSSAASAGPGPLAQAPWPRPSGPGPLAQAPWHRPPGPGPLAQAPWPERGGTPYYHTIMITMCVNTEKRRCGMVLANIQSWGQYIFFVPLLMYN